MADTPPNPYPEHARLAAVKQQSQACGSFLEWLKEQDYVVCYRDTNTREYEPVRDTTQQLLARFFEIDLARLQAEKEAMYEEQVSLNAAQHQP